ncbi:hypothetical protein JXD20_00180 [Candidatus Peregrinibacteria bacterium]|nr:hypothetical protein [Candidatus Peregrinibacteria bacterium]
MKYLGLILFSVFILTSCGGDKVDEFENIADPDLKEAIQADMMAIAGSSDYTQDYEKIDDILADITAEMHQPDILKSDIIRGWYLGGQSDKKYGTPDTWIFVEDGENSKWMSPNMLEEEFLIDDRQLCMETAGTYITSCLQTSAPDCDYVGESYCKCVEGSKWKDEQGCILVTERGAYVAINSEELEKGWYFGLPNEKKLNTPVDWIWVELGRQSVWQKPG